MDNFNREKVISKNIAWYFGVISIILAIGSFEIFSRFIHCNANKSWVGWVFLYFLFIMAVGIWGLIKSIKNFKHSKRTVGIMEITLNILGIVLAILLGYGAVLTIFVCTT